MKRMPPTRLKNQQPSEPTDSDTPYKRVALVGASVESGNLGVCALGRSQAAAVREACGQRTRVRFVSYERPAGAGPALDADFTGKPLGLKSLVRNYSSISNEISGHDLVLDAGQGDSYSDIYGWKSASRRILVRQGLKPENTVVSPQTFGPFQYWITGRWAASVSAKFSTNWARDPISFELLGEWGVPAKLATDVAFSLPFSEGALPLERSRFHLGFNVSGLLWGNRFYDETSAAMYRKEVRELIQGVRSGTIVHLIPHVTNFAKPGVDDDMVPLAMLKNEPNVVVHPMPKSPEDAKSLISCMDFMVSPRMHAAIAGVSSGTPTVPLGYSRKCKPLFENLGYQETIAFQPKSPSRFASEVLARIDDAPSMKKKARAAQRNAVGLLIPWKNEVRTKLEWGEKDA